MPYYAPDVKIPNPMLEGIQALSERDIHWGDSIRELKGPALASWLSQSEENLSRLGELFGKINPKERERLLSSALSQAVSWPGDEPLTRWALGMGAQPNEPVGSTRLGLPLSLAAQALCEREGREPGLGLLRMMPVIEALLGAGALPQARPVGVRHAAKGQSRSAWQIACDRACEPLAKRLSEDAGFKGSVWDAGPEGWQPWEWLRGGPRPRGYELEPDAEDIARQARMREFFFKHAVGMEPHKARGLVMELAVRRGGMRLALDLAGVSPECARALRGARDSQGRGVLARSIGGPNPPSVEVAIEAMAYDDLRRRDARGMRADDRALLMMGKSHSLTRMRNGAWEPREREAAKARMGIALMLRAIPGWEPVGQARKRAEAGQPSMVAKAIENAMPGITRQARMHPELAPLTLRVIRSQVAQEDPAAREGWVAGLALRWPRGDECDALKSLAQKIALEKVVPTPEVASAPRSRL